MKTWVDKRIGFKSKFEIKFYPARYDGEGFFSIFPVGEALFVKMVLFTLHTSISQVIEELLKLSEHQGSAEGS